MASPTKIQHPLLRHPGTSQRKRSARSEFLRPDLAPIDGRTLGDMLDFVHEYARLVVFHEYKVDANGQGYTELSNWLMFFQNSLPFTLNRFSRLDFNQLGADLCGFHEAIRHNPNDANLRLLLDFCYHDLLTPLNHLQLTAREPDFTPLLNRFERAVRTTLSAPLQDFIELNNAAVRYFCTSKYDLKVFEKAPWGISHQDTLAINEFLEEYVAGKDAAVIWLSDNIVEAAQRFLKAQRGVAAEIPGLLNASINHLEKQNYPHLGLLYTFLRLFKHFQGDLNNLTQKHLEFFYNEVLNLKLRKIEPDQVHLVFEAAKHLDSHQIKQGTLFKDSKDNNNADILFGLDEEIVIDHAKVVALKTLFLNPSLGSLKGESGKDAPRPVEGVYIAPVANSADGKGEAFRDGQSKSWAALGAKESKYAVTDEGNKAVIQKHPSGRIGFVLASSVLWLNEGQRDVTIKLTCDASGNLDVFTGCFQDYISKLFNSEEEALDHRLFHLEFSGVDGWFAAKNNIQFHIEYADVTGKSDQTVILIFQVRLDMDEPAVAFYDEEVVGEFLAKEAEKDTKKEGGTLKSSPFPMVRILLKPEVYIECDAEYETKNCCLAKENDIKSVLVSSYHFLRDLELKDAAIDVKVCGLKNLIVQNEESLQDVNSPILPFGPRPKIGAEFYIGSKELFCKNWSKFGLYVDWKDLPDSLRSHYRYYSFKPFEDGSNEIFDESFKFKAAVLDAGSWKEWDLNPKPIFSNHENFNFCHRELYHPCDLSSFYKEFIRADFDGLNFKSQLLNPDPMGPLKVHSDKGFLRMKLSGVSFQHELYAFVLARKLIKLSGGLDPASLEDMRYNLRVALTVCGLITEKINDLNLEINKIADSVNIPQGLEQLKNSAFVWLSEIQTAEADGTVPPVPRLNSLLALINNDLDSLIGNFQGNILELDKIANHSVNEQDLEATIDALSIQDPPISASTKAGLKQLTERLCKVESDGTTTIKTGALHNLNELFGKTDDDVGLPKEPYTPLIKALEIDYHASADVNDIELIHLHPFPKASKTEVLTSNPTLLPTFTDAGTLFVGLEKLKPLSNLNLLLQFAEATADSESGLATIKWQYLAANEWKDLRRDFEIISDKTEQMTRSGIVKIALPEDISNQGNTIMPPTEDGHHLFWLKVSAPDSVAGVAELMAVHAQAAVATYQPLAASDPSRVATPVDSEQVSKSLQPDFGIKKALQPYKSFGGRVAETSGKIPARMGELLRHKGRSVDAFDIEHLVLEAFPELFKCKCISHTLGLSAKQYRRDLEVAPGHMVVAVVPDLTKLESGDISQPMVPVSILSKVKKLLQQRASPFARIRVMNPRYEKVHVCVELQLKRGRDESYYLSQFKTDLGHFLAPWYLGDSDKLSFGQHLVYSDVLGFVESLEYVEHVTNLHLSTHKIDPDQKNDDKTLKKIIPLTARSILTCAPENITVINNNKACPESQEGSANKTTLADFLRNAKPVDCGQETSGSEAKKAHNGQ